MDDFKSLVREFAERLGIIEKGSTEITKSQEVEERVSIEVIYEPDTKDEHGEWMSKDTIQKGCQDFNEYLEKGVIQPNLFHVRNTDKFEIQKTWINEEMDVTVDESGESLKAGTWVAKIHYKDENLWALKKEGVITGVSIYCRGKLNETTGEISNLTFEWDEDEDASN